MTISKGFSIRCQGETEEGVEDMRFIYGIFACFVWSFFCMFLMSKYDMKVSNDIQILSTAIIIAGAMAGGD